MRHISSHWGGQCKSGFLAAMIAVVCFCLSSVGCKAEDEGGKESVTDANDARDWGEWGQGGGAVFASAFDVNSSRKACEMMKDEKVSFEAIDRLDPSKYPPPSLLVYEWKKDGTFGGAGMNIALPQTVSKISWLPLHRRYSLIRSKKDPREGSVYFWEVYSEKGQIIRKYAVPSGWWPCRADVNENGQFLTVGLVVDRTNRHAPADYNPVNNNYLRVELLDCKTGEMSTVATIDRIKNPLVRRMIASNDGKCIAVGSIENGVALFDVAAKKRLWNVRPPSALNLNHVAFSPDGNTVYAGGSEGRLYVFDAKTGEILHSRWAAPDAKSGKIMAGGNRFASLVVSPNGKYIAGSAERTYVWNAKTLEVVKTSSHGAVMGMQFSPTSKKLALVWPGEYLVLAIEE